MRRINPCALSLCLSERWVIPMEGECITWIWALFRTKWKPIDMNIYGRCCLATIFVILHFVSALWQNGNNNKTYFQCFHSQFQVPKTRFEWPGLLQLHLSCQYISLLFFAKAKMQFAVVRWISAWCIKKRKMEIRKSSRDLTGHIIGELPEKYFEIAEISSC